MLEAQAVEAVLALLGTAGVVTAIAANFTTIANFLANRRRRIAGVVGVVGAAPQAADVPGGPELAGTTPHGLRLLDRVPPEAVAAAPRRASPVVIRTPDQRVRVFVSSTLHELADERTAARSAIESLRLTPVMFEMGARPHPPRDLYRAYLAQSDVFVAIYGHRYGWVAPGEEVSGLEDEYLLSGERPRLVYVKRQDGPREPRLETLLERVSADDRASYRSFADASELGELLAEDLATLLSERFGDGSGVRAGTFAPIPAPWGPVVGREHELERACALLQDPTVRLVTLLGPGGIGKSRLALEIAERVRGRRCAGVAPDGVAFVGLQEVRDPALVPGAIAAALAVRTEGRDVVQALKDYLAPLEVLLVLDNLEQLLGATPLLAELLEAAPGLRMLVTSRALLRLSAERALRLAPLPLPPAADSPAAALAVARTNPAVQLFVWRAGAVAELSVDEASAPLLVDIVRRLDGWPLAIVLAASRVGHLSLAQLSDRLERRLDVLVGGARDMPERQQTLRSTIEWSLEFLSPAARRVLAWLGAFVGGTTLEAVERLTELLDPPLGREPVAVLAELVEHSLLQRIDTPAGGRYVMLEMIREAAAERLEGSAEAAAVRAAHARVFLELGVHAGPTVFHAQGHWYRLLVQEGGNLRAALLQLVEAGDAAALARLAGALWLFWGMQGQHREHIPWIERALERDDLHPGDRVQLLLAGAALRIQLGEYASGERLMAEGERLLPQHPDPRLETTWHLGRSIVATHHRDYPAAIAAAERARQLATELGSPWASSFAEVMLARIATAQGRLEDALTHTTTAIEQQVVLGDQQSEGWARASAAVVLTLGGRCREALEHVHDALLLFSRLGFHQASVNALYVAAFVHARAGDRDRAARLAGAAASATAHFGITAFEPETSIIAAALAELQMESDPTLRQPWLEGRAMPIDVAARYALAEGARTP